MFKEIVNEPAEEAVSQHTITSNTTSIAFSANQSSVLTVGDTLLVGPTLGAKQRKRIRN